MVMVDQLTKYARFVALSDPYTTKDVAPLFVEELVPLHGFPKTIVSNRDRLFMSHIRTELFKMAGTRLQFTTAYHPQPGGRSEVVNICLGTYLRCFAGFKPKNWPQWWSREY